MTTNRSCFCTGPDATGKCKCQRELVVGELNCKCCGGSGVQTKLDGVKLYCPACNGTGESPFVNQNIKFPPVPFDKVQLC